MSFLIVWLLLAALWLGISGYFDTVHLVFGFVSVTLVSALSHRHLTGGGRIRTGVGRLARLIVAVPWLLWQIALANVDVMLRVIAVRPIDPRIVRLRPKLASEFGMATLANSITLTPGTVTVEIEKGEFIVHALSNRAAEGLLAGDMERMAVWIEGRGEKGDD